MNLTPKQQRFVEEYLIDLNATQAAIRAGYSARTADRIGPELLGKTWVAAAIREAQETRAQRVGLTNDEILRQLHLILMADPRELVQVKTGCCRHCWGEGYKYQRTVAEMNHDRERWAERGKDLAEFDELGGIGFDPLLQPNPECPECCGDGRARTVLTDTRNLSPAAAALYAGAEQTRHGIKILMHSKMEAREKAGRHTGFYNRPPVRFALPKIEKAQDCAAAMAAVLAAVAAGELPVDDGRALTDLIEAQRKTFETADIAERLEAIEKALGGKPK